MNSRQQHILRLIGRFYDGLTDVGEEREIIRYFSETPLSEIPQGLLGERRFFIALYDASCVTEREAPLFPGEMAARIERSIRAEAMKEQAAAASRRGRLWRFCGIAASLALLIGTGAALVIHTGSQSDEKQEMSASASKVANVNESPAPDAQPAAIPQTAPASTAYSVVRHTTHAPAVAAPRNVSAAPAVPDVQAGIREVTDVREAEEILAKVEALIAANLDAGTSALDNADRMFGREMEKVDKIKTMDI